MVPANGLVADVEEWRDGHTIPQIGDYDMNLLGVRKPPSMDMKYNQQGEVAGLVDPDYPRDSKNYQGMSVTYGAFPKVPRLLPRGYPGSQRKATDTSVILFKIQTWIIDTTPGIKFYPDKKDTLGQPVIGTHGVVGPSHNCESYRDEYKPAIESTQDQWWPEYMEEPTYSAPSGLPPTI